MIVAEALHVIVNPEFKTYSRDFLPLALVAYRQWCTVPNFDSAVELCTSKPYCSRFWFLTC